MQTSILIFIQIFDIQDIEFPYFRCKNCFFQSDSCLTYPTADIESSCISAVSVKLSPSFR